MRNHRQNEVSRAFQRGFWCRLVTLSLSLSSQTTLISTRIPSPTSDWRLSQSPDAIFHCERTISLTFKAKLIIGFPREKANALKELFRRVLMRGWGEEGWKLWWDQPGTLGETLVWVSCSHWPFNGNSPASLLCGIVLIIAAALRTSSEYGKARPRFAGCPTRKGGQKIFL